jgi:hypothetical protein
MNYARRGGAGGVGLRYAFVSPSNSSNRLFQGSKNFPPAGRELRLITTPASEHPRKLFNPTFQQNIYYFNVKQTKCKSVTI